MVEYVRGEERDHCGAEISGIEHNYQYGHVYIVV